MSEFVTLLPCSGKDWERGNSHAFSECRRKKRSWLVPFSFLLIASLGTIFVVWLLLVWERVRCQMPCREVAEKWDFSTAKLMLEKKKIPKSFNRKLQKTQIFPSVANWEAETKHRQDEQKWSDFVQKE